MLASLWACARKERLWPKTVAMKLAMSFFLAQMIFAYGLLTMVEPEGRKLGLVAVEIALLIGIGSCLGIFVLTVLGDWLERVHLRYRTYRRGPRHRTNTT
jgi:hypothetical protein